MSQQDQHAPAPSQLQPAAADAASTSQLATLMRNRAATYAFLSRLYRTEVDEALLAELRAMKFPAKTGTPEIDEGYRLIRSYLGNAWENVITELAVDYTRTFIGHGNTAYCAAYPYESVYTSGRRLLMQEARDEVLALYRKAGKGKAQGWNDPEDHVALELEFQGYLCTQAAEALDAGDEDGAFDLVVQQRSFLNDHLANWLPMMLADLDRFAQTDFYRGLGHLTRGVLQAERATLDELLADEG